MSTTMTLTMSQAPGVHACPSCGTGLPDHTDLATDAQKRIEDLEAQVRLLTAKATAAVDRWADYEDEIQQLKEQQQRHNDQADEERERGPTSPGGGRFSYLPVQNRLSSFLTARKSTPNLRPSLPPSTPTETELVAALTKEQALRQAAEGKLSEASGELEDLTAQLFMQANEMVATERKARAKLEERVEVLERRDTEKRKRLERLEGAVQRIERVRGCLRREVECEDQTRSSSRVGTIRRGGGLLVRKEMGRYFRTRTADVRFPGRWAKRPPHPDSSKEADISNYYPANFRHHPPATPPTLPSLALEIPDFELWLTELWNDFLIEPTPYLVASATIYLGFVLLLSQYYAAILQLSCFMFQFVPWDDDLRYL